MPSDNPAQRLHDFLQAMRAQPGDESLQRAFARVVQLENQNPPGLLSAAADIAALPDKAARDLRILHTDEDDQNLFLQWYPNAYSAVGVLPAMAGQTVQTMLNHYTDTTLMSLVYAARELRASGSASIAEPQLDRLSTELANLRQAIEEDAGLDPKLRMFLLDLLAEMDRALRMYRFTGVDGLEEAFERAIGSLYVRMGRTLPPVAPPQQGIWRRFMNFMTDLGNVVSTAQGGVELGSTVIQQITSGS